jgi:UDP-4-amino-4,6-dideoxy-N-acetyl-beta-L-altrosamine transaminase
MKFIPYGHQQIDSDDIREVVRVLKTDWITQGPKVRKFEEAFCKYTGAKYAVAVSSGTAALHIACLAGDIKKGDEVITSPITFVASANCVLYCGGKPVFADVEEGTINIDPKEIEKRISKRTKAIIPVHFAGHPADLEEIYDIAKKYNLLIIEDAAHALGARYKREKIGSCKYSDMAIFSFHPVKSITTGEGGAVLTNRKDLYEKLLILRNHGITKDRTRFTVSAKSGSASGGRGSRFTGPWYYEQQYLGFNYRITDFQCALGANQLKKLDEFLERRRKIKDIYNQQLSKIDKIILPKEKECVNSSWHIYFIRLKNPAKRKIVFDMLQKAGIGAQVHYIPIHLQPYYKKQLGYKEGDYPKAEDYYKRTLTIPIFPTMKPKDTKYIANTLNRILK